jgi:hypothetical protein
MFFKKRRNVGGMSEDLFLEKKCDMSHASSNAGLKTECKKASSLAITQCRARRLAPARGVPYSNQYGL